LPADLRELVLRDEPWRVRSGRWSTAALAVAYVFVAAALLITRFAEIGHSLWHDELATVRDYIDYGPRYILTGAGISHELFALLASASRPLLGESEIAYRLWSAVPFVLGVVLVTIWVHTRVRPLAGLLFLYLATVSPLLLDITRQARGYGLAFLAMAVLVVAALEALRGGRTWAVVAFCVAGILGTWDLPQVAIAFLTTAAVLLFDRRLRKRILLGLGPLLLASSLWWVPHLDEVRAVSLIEDGVQIHAPWVVTAPLDQTVIPALIWIDGIVLVAGVLWLPLVLLACVLMGSSPLARDRRHLLVLVAGVVSTIVVLWLGGAYVVPRYLSFLLVPLFVLLATGMADVLGRPRQRPAVLRTIATVVLLGALAVRFVVLAPEIVRFPREAWRDAANAIEAKTPPHALVLAYLHNPDDLAFYLRRPIHALGPGNVARRVCGAHVPVAYVYQPFGIRPVNVPCLARPGVIRYRFRQYARGDEMNVWIVPPVGRSS